MTSEGRAHVGEAIKPLAVAAGVMRARELEPRDYWRGYAEARAASTAPIYAGELGYRDKMDGDSGGMACVPYRGI